MATAGMKGGGRKLISEDTNGEFRRRLPLGTEKGRKRERERAPISSKQGELLRREEKSTSHSTAHHSLARSAGLSFVSPSPLPISFAPVCLYITG